MRREVVRGVPKLCGADVELGNFVLGLERLNGTGYEASRALLREIEAPYAERGVYGMGGYAYNPQDWGRKFLASNGGCAYIDLDHLEICQPEVLSAYDHVAAWHAMLRIARGALDAANAKLPAGQTIHVLVNNSDGRGNAYGSHLNFLVTRRSLITAGFGAPAGDDAARRDLAALFPGREIRMLGVGNILRGGGGIRCLTQPVPA